MNINDYTNKLTNHLMADMEDSLIDCLEENAHEIIEDTLRNEIYRCIAQAVAEAKEEVKNEISANKPKHDSSENDIDSLMERLKTLCEESVKGSNVVSYAITVMGKEACGISLNVTGLNLVYMIRKIIDVAVAENSGISKSDIIAMLNVPFDLPIDLDK